MSAKVYYPRESAYDLLQMETEEMKKEKPPRYVSKFRPTVVEEEKLPKCPMKTMGPANIEVPSPENYLKKHSKEPKLPDKPHSGREGRIHSQRKPPIPSRTERPPMGLHTRPDLSNTLTFVTKKPKAISVDTRGGHKEVLENSGLVPKYINKKDFGKVPAYLQHQNAEKQRAQEEYNRYVAEQKERQSMKCLTEEERLQMLGGLKKEWDRLHWEYQRQSVIIDTITKRAHKERLEAKMKLLEHDISNIERFKIIYLAEN